MAFRFFMKTKGSRARIPPEDWRQNPLRIQNESFLTQNLQPLLKIEAKILSFNG